MSKAEETPQRLAEFTSDEAQADHLAALEAEAAYLRQNAEAPSHTDERRKALARRAEEAEAEASRIRGDAGKQTRPRGAGKQTR